MRHGSEDMGSSWFLGHLGPTGLGQEAEAEAGAGQTSLHGVQPVPRPLPSR